MLFDNKTELLQAESFVTGARVTGQKTVWFITAKLQLNGHKFAYMNIWHSEAPPDRGLRLGTLFAHVYTQNHSTEDRPM